MSSENNKVQKPCVFCNDPENNEIKYGKIYQHNEIITHYYCLLLSSNMQQRGKDEEGILGFLPVDIQRELNRGKRLKCSFCGKKGATLGCVNRKCKKVFHLPCGLENNTLHQFFDQFKSFCQTHRPIQQIDINVRDSTPECTMCYICYDVVSRKDIYKTLWAPCCKKNAWFHRDCVQQLALSAGYFFKCPLCNNKKEFQTAMQESGIFVPSQDASWELVPNAFHELLYRHNRCDANECKCPLGRDHISTNNPEWELILCRTCGSQGTHVTCGKLKWAKISWDCNDCLSILSKNFNETTRDNNHNAATTTTTIITTIDSDNDVDIDEDDDDDDIDDDDDDDEDDDDSESDISLGHNSPCNLINKINISSINLKPGPRSAKLKQLHKTVKILPELPATIEQLNNILDEQQSSNYFQPNVSTSKNQSSNTVNNSKNSQHCQKKIEKNNEKEKKKEEEEEEEEISILEVKKIEKPLSRVATLTQKTTSSLLNNSENANIIDEISFNSSVNKYPELSIERTKKLGSETTLCQQQLRVDNDNVSSISQPTTAAAGVTATAIPNIDTTTRQIPTSPSVLENNNNNNNRVVEDVIIVESDDENDQLLLTSSPSLRVPVVTVENTLSSLLVNEQVDNQLDQFSTQSKLVTTTESIEINNDVIINSEDSLMNIKITGVTSLPPEVFAQVPDISNNTTNDSIDSTTLNLTQNLISSSSSSPSPSSSSSALFNVNNHFTSSVLTAVPVTSIFNKRKADSPSVLSRLVDKVNDVIDKNNKESMNVSCPKRPRQDLSSTTTIITTTPLTTNTCTTCISSNSLNVATDMITTTKSQQNYFKNYSKSMNSDISTSNQYSNGISLANSAVIKVYNQQYIVPLGETTDDSAPTISIAPEQTIMSLNDISSRLSGQQINSDGDAGSKPAGELTVCPTTTTTTTPSSPPSSSPPPTTTTTTTDIIVNSIPELHSSSTGATSATETSKLSTTPTATTTTTATESALFSSIELLQKLPSLPKISTKSPDDDPGAARTRITIPRTRKYDHTISDQTNDNTRSNRFGLIKHKVSLRDLKFRVCSGNSIEITMDDNYRMNVNLDTAIKSSINGQRLRSGRSGVCLVKPRSSRVRGPKSKRKNHEDCVNYNLTTNNDDTITVVNNSLILSKNDDSASNEEIRDGNNILLSLNSTTTTTTTSIPAASYSASNNNEGNLVNNINYNNQSHQRDTAKENLVPDKLYQQSNNTIDSLAKHDNNNVNIKKSRVEFIRRKLRSSKHLSDIDENFTDTSYNINNNNSNNSNSSNNNNNNNNDDDDDDNIRCHVSIDLTRIKSLIDSKPNLFIKKTRSWDKLVNLNDNELNLKFNNTISERNRSLKRSYSFDNISSSNHYKFITPTTANNTVPTTTTTTTMTNLSDNNSFSSEVMFNSQQSKKIKKRRSFKKSNRVR